ncbi:dUTP diphosphatase [Heliophilum fasciatum]|uniref:dUTP diphosphatase n=1 Tax=Heliophilum fasciatum TaxID=35700 RepID=A0A4R2RCT4_9FIRM|nr:hypothetical protein [Heliophilum fasciatum]MCW2279247.1 dUTP pyrophosphatase [Heliophilum fasciatum]TCP60623.1 dUTP pyrophosphatase [Heliophilum fasciatum]
MNIKMMKLHYDAILPTRKSEYSNRFDLYALGTVPPDELYRLNESRGYSEYWVYPGEFVLVRTGIAVEPLEDMDAQVRSVISSVTADKKVTLLNSLIALETSFFGELAIILTNVGDEPICIREGDKIAQLVFPPVIINLEHAA